MKRLGWLLFFLLVIYFIFLLRQDIIDHLELKKEKSRVEKKYQNEQNLTQELNRKLELLQKESYLEELARTRLGMIKRGERAYKVINDQ